MSSWLIHRSLLLCGLTLFAFKDCRGLFLRHTRTGKCVAASEELVYNSPEYSLPYFVVMTDNCLNDTAQFRYLDGELLHNIEKEGTLVSPDPIDTRYNGRWAVYKGVTIAEKSYQKRAQHRLKQTNAGYLFLYSMGIPVYAKPLSQYVARTRYPKEGQEEFTLGSVTAFNAVMENVHCSSIQHMMVKSADYGDFDNSGAFNKNANIDTQCSILTNCQVKSLCGGQRSCELTMDRDLLPSQYCSDTSKQIYTKYTCVDTYSSRIITAPNIRLRKRHPFSGYVQIKDGSAWRYVVNKNWDKNRQKVLCQHLGFSSKGDKAFSTSLSSGTKIASGDMECYNTNGNQTSCCIHLYPSIATGQERLPFANCKIWDNPLLEDETTFPDEVFSGYGGSDYQNARFSESGWCSTMSGSYLLLDLQREYRIKHVVVMGDEDQTKWSSSYSMQYSHSNTSVDHTQAIQIKGNNNGYQASITKLESVYNARYLKIKSTAPGSTDFCLRIELDGTVQTPAPVSIINVSASEYSASVMWRTSTSKKDSSYITQIIIYLNNQEHKTISRATQFTIDGLIPNTTYTVGIQTQDGSSQKSQIVNETFITNETGGTLQECHEEKIRLDLLIPLVIFVLWFLLSLGIILYQRRLIRNNNKQPGRNYETPKQAHRKDPESHNITMKAIKAAPEGLYGNEDGEYESPDNETQPEIATGQESLTYMSLKDNREPGNVYQSLQQPNIQTVEYENPVFTSNKKKK